MEHLLRRRGDTAQLQQDAAAYGVILEPHHLAPQDFRLWAELWPAVQLFMRCLTQWRATSTGVLGLDYGVLLQLAPVFGVTVNAAMMDDIQAMEAQAIETLNRRT